MSWFLPHVALGLVALASAVLPAAPAGAHSSDPRMVTVVDQVAPSLPDGVVVQAQAGIAARLVADNPTSAVLQVLTTSGEPFLRISAAGVEANLASPDFFTTSSPEGAVAAVPDGAVAGAPARWVQISNGSSWGWYDHRLHPESLRAPADAEREQRLAEWTVPLRYGDQDVEVRGVVRYSRLRGAFLVTADGAPDGLAVQALPGMLPGLYLSNPDRLPVLVLGRDGEPFLRLGPQGVEVNVASRTHVEDRRARGLPAEPPSPTPRFELVDARATSYTWLDTRLRYPDVQPPPEVMRAGSPTVVSTWEVPVLRDGRQSAVTGSVRWVPRGGPTQSQTGALLAEDAGGGRVRGALLAGAAVLLVGVVAALRRRTPARPSRSVRDEPGARGQG